MLKQVVVGIGVLTLLTGPATAQNKGAVLEDKIERLQQQMLEMQKELDTLRTEQKKATEAVQQQKEDSSQQIQAAREEVLDQTTNILSRTRIGGYGSLRFEGNSLDEQENTFTFRRFVLTAEGNIAPRLSYGFELEFERFRKLELEKNIGPDSGGVLVKQGIEGTSDSEIALEQAWLQYDLTDWLSLRGGAMLVPLGRFNIRHDDNLWNLPRRSLVDKGVPVLPAAAAWDELGFGLIGKTPVGEQASLAYQLYVMNGVSLDYELEHIVHTRTPQRSKLEAEVELSPSTGTFSNDPKEAKSLAGRLAFSPALGHEFAGSFYWGRYTPQFLKKENVISLAFDGLTHLGPIELEGQYVFSHFEGLRNVARSFAKTVHHQAREVESEFSPDLETEIEFELANLAQTKHGYWLEARYPFWPSFLSQTILGWELTNPQLVPVLRWEQVWMPSLLREAAFESGALTEFKTESRFINRITAGLAYRPHPLVAFTLAYEYTWTNDKKSLGNVSNFLPALARENKSSAILAGMTFGF